MLDPVDVYIGQVVRDRRRVLRITQQQLAQAIGVTFQQVQKYEKGTNRISAARLAQISEVTRTPISTFFPEKNNDSRAVEHHTNIMISATKLGLAPMVENIMSLNPASQSFISDMIQGLAELEQNAGPSAG